MAALPKIDWHLMTFPILRLIFYFAFLWNLFMQLFYMFTMSWYIRNCKNIGRLINKESKISFHRQVSLASNELELSLLSIPNNSIMFRQWLHLICPHHVDPDRITWKKTMFICSQHFKLHDFVPNSKIRILKALVIPTVNLPDCIEENTKYKTIQSIETSRQNLVC